VYTYIKIKKSKKLNPKVAEYNFNLKYIPTKKELLKSKCCKTKMSFYNPKKSQ
jgi:hypothetical protein